MPLPTGGPLSLHVHSSLGNAVQSKPKQAMIIRMSAETLEALESFPTHPEMNFDFGDAPGIYIGDAFYPMRSLQESTPHEIYLRTSSAAKPNAPLKLYANVIGKFIVERQLDAKVTDGVRQRAMEVKKAHSERHAILLDQPPVQTTGSKSSKRKAPGSGTVIKKSATPLDTLRTPSSSTMPSRKVSPLPVIPPSSRANADVRRRLVHCLAIHPRYTDEVIKMVGGPSVATQAREDLLALLDDVAEQVAPAKKGDKSPRPWTLKTQTWVEVRPYEWPKLTEAERTTMARQARLALKALKIPETDPAWDNVRYRNTAPTIGPPVQAAPSIAPSNSRSSATTSSVSAPAQPEPRRPVMSKETKQKKSDASRMKGEIAMKDESAKVSASRMVSLKEDAEKQASSSSDSAAAKAGSTRRLPGSGYQAKKTPPGSALGADSVTGKSSTSSDARSMQRHSLPSSLPPKPASPLPPNSGSQMKKTIPSVPPRSSKRADESDRERDRELERVREHEQREREKRKELKLKERQREKLAKEKSTPTSSKRKAATLEPEDMLDEDLSSRAIPIPKKRKVEEGGSSNVMPLSSKTRDQQLSKKAVQEPVPTLQKIKQELSPPLRGSSSGQDKPSPSPPSPSLPKVERPKANGSSARFRRKSPIYTSSEDEGEIRQAQPPPRQRKASPPPPPPPSSGTDPRQNGKGSYHRPRASYPLPTDPTALRSLYQSVYVGYLESFTKIFTQKQRIEAMLNGESGSEIDLMDQDDLLKLSVDYNTAKEELESIQEMYLKGKSSSPSE
ncbi:hypothetical protein ID866_3134 [Astraeus odoratus]|nr:hypothetical protein ID866_3134 [Astraeus odoratus]